MDSYVVSVDRPKPTRKQKLLLLLMFGGFYAVVEFCSKWFWPLSAERHCGLTSLAVEAGFTGLFFGIWMAYAWPRLLKSEPFSYKLLVDDESITVIKGNSRWKWLGSCTTVRKGKLRTILDLKSRFGSHRGIGLSERGKFGARMLGFVFVPNTLPEYEDIRQLAESWLPKAEVD